MKRQVTDNQSVYKGIEYQEKTYFSAIELVPGNASVEFFARTENQNMRNYKAEVNVFDSAHGGRVMQIGMNFYSPNFATPKMDASSTAMVDAYSQLVATGEIELKRGSDVVDEIQLSKLLPPAPWLMLPLTASATEKAVPNAVVYSPASTNIMKKNYRENPLRFKQNEGLKFSLRFSGNFTIPAILSGYILKAELDTQVFLSEDRSLGIPKKAKPTSAIATVK